MTKASHLCKSLQGGGSCHIKVRTEADSPSKVSATGKILETLQQERDGFMKETAAPSCVAGYSRAGQRLDYDLNQAMMVTIKDKGYGRMKQGSVKAYRLLASAPSATARESTSEARTLRSRFRPLASPSSSLCREQSAGHRMHCWWSPIKC